MDLIKKIWDIGKLHKAGKSILGGSARVLGSSTEQLTVTSSPTEKGSMPRTNAGKPGIKDGLFCVTGGPWPHPVSVALFQLLLGLPVKTQGWCVCMLRLEVLRSKAAEAGEVLGMGQMQHNVTESTIPLPSASSLSLWSRKAPTTWYLMAQRGLLVRGPCLVRQATLVFEFFSLLSMF